MFFAVFSFALYCFEYVALLNFFFFFFSLFFGGRGVSLFSVNTDGMPRNVTPIWTHQNLDNSMTEYFATENII